MTPQAPPSTLAAIERIMTVLYQSISGTDDSERDWDLSKSLFHPDARVSPNAFENRGRGIMTEDEFQADARPRIAPQAFFEWEVERDVHITGQVASVRSHYRAAETLHGEPIIKEGVNHLILIKEEDKWQIMAMAWKGEGSQGSQENKAPTHHAPGTRYHALITDY